MAKLNTIFQGGFDANAVEPDAGRDFEPLPAGAYEVEISNADVKDTKNGNGCYLSLELTVLGPTHTGRKVWSNITLKNPNAQAEQIGHGQLSALCHAVGIPKLDDSDQLFQKILRVRLKVSPPKGDFPARNEVTAYEAVGGNAQAPATSRPAANQAPTPAAAKAAPWARK